MGNGESRCSKRHYSKGYAAAQFQKHQYRKKVVAKKRLDKYVSRLQHTVTKRRNKLTDILHVKEYIERHLPKDKYDDLIEWLQTSYDEKRKTEIDPTVENKRLSKCDRHERIWHMLFFINPAELESESEDNSDDDLGSWRYKHAYINRLSRRNIRDLIDYLKKTRE